MRGVFRVGCVVVALVALVAGCARPTPLTPTPQDAYADVPSRPGCQMPSVTDDLPPVVCEYGDRRSEHVVMLVGDSKMVQWRPAFDALAQERGWRLVQVTKSACAFTDAMTVLRGAAWTDCRQWGRSVLDLVLRERPDLVVTSQRRPTAMTGADPGEVSADAMADGLASYWSRIERAGIDLAVLLDNPGPRDVDAPQCLAEHPDDVAACSFDTATALEASAAGVQQAAARRVPGVTLVDVNREVCPAARCSPVNDGVLVFRQGTHVTATFAAGMASRIGAALPG